MQVINSFLTPSTPEEKQLIREKNSKTKERKGHEGEELEKHLRSKLHEKDYNFTF